MDRNQDKHGVKFIYIMGRGHSGSTLLDTILGNSRYIESVGELVSALGRVNTEVCSCGLKMIDCDHWKSVLAGYRETAKELSFEEFCKQSTKQANIGKFPGALIDKTKYNSLLGASFLFFEQIASVSHKRFILDSSKEHTRGLLFSRSENAYVIHLIRRPDRILSSTYFRAVNGETVKILRKRFQPKNKLVFFMYIIIMSISWTVGNFLAEIVKLVSKNKVLTVRYEDLVENPVAQLMRIQNHIGVDLSDVIFKIQTDQDLEIGHNLGGNRFRFDKKFKVQPKKSVQRKLPAVFSITTKIINLPFMLYYSYNPLK